MIQLLLVVVKAHVASYHTCEPVRIEWATNAELAGSSSNISGIVVILPMATTNHVI